MISLDEYRNALCAVLSIPYWKAKSIRIPDHIKILHGDDYVPEAWDGWSDEPYFRLYHSLDKIPAEIANDFFIRTAGPADYGDIVDIINCSYPTPTMDMPQLERMTQTPVFCAELWVMACDQASGMPAGCGIADYDPEVGEGVLEWIQVLPEHRGRHVGKLIVLELLRRMPDTAQFATVSGQCNNPTNPERLYRGCGFVGNDVWHILSKKSGETIGKNP